MKKIITKFLAIACVAIASSVTVFAQGTLSGTVSEGGKGIPYATVALLNTVYGALTTESGTFEVKGVPAGVYNVKVSAIGFATLTQAVSIKSGEVTTYAPSLKADNLQLDEVVITGLLNPKSALQSSVSISTIDPVAIANAAPRSTAEILRSITGVRSEASGGDGNTNITVRGVPIATGGSKFLQLHEDGLPVLQFGDIAFATADIFLRADNTISRIEAIRGGNASTLASNSPAGIINFISKHGEVEGGSLASTIGLDFNSLRTDFEYGSPIGNNVSFHLGGFFRQGDGPRKAGFISNQGGQLKANLTKTFGKGYARVYLKYLNDRTAAYMPMPMQVEGTNSNPTWSSVAGYDALHGTLQSPYLQTNIGTGPDGQLRRSNVADGMHPVSTAIGSEFAFDLGSDWSVMNRSRWAMNSGRFVAPFPAQVGDAASIAGGITGGNPYTLSYTTGEAFPSNANGNNLLMRMHLFDTELNNFDNFTNDFSITKSFEKVKLTAGYYKAYQNISMSWVWNSYLTDVTDDGIRLLNLADTANNYTDNGVLAYGVPAWGNCCHRNYDTKYDIGAPYGAVEVNLTNLNIDASFRYDQGTVTGSYAGGNGQTKPMDVNGDGNISYVEQNVATINNNSTKPVNYDYGYLSYSIGANYMIKNNLAIFARHSTGGRANADRLLFGPFILPNGKAADGLSADMVTQTELGVKYRNANYFVNATAFLSNVEEQNYEATTQKSVNRVYGATGLELEGGVVVKGFELRGGLTFTQAEIKEDELDSTKIGNTPRRQAPVIFSIVPMYRFKKHSIGISVIGTGKSFAQDDNKLVMPGYAYFNPFINLAVTEKLGLSININNLTDQIGVTESEEGSITENAKNVVRARSITGRTVSATLRYNF